MIYAEKRREDGGDGYYTLRWFVWNGDLLGTYGIHFKPNNEPYGASRDYHRPATEAEIKANTAWEMFRELPEAEQDKRFDDGTEPDYGYPVDGCIYHDNKPCVCDGSSLVEVNTDDKRAYEIAAMMAEVTKETI